MKFLITTVSFITFTTSFLYSQNNVSKTVEKEQVQTISEITFAKELPKEGTYQIIYKATERIPLIDNEILFTVNEKRKAEEVEYIIVDEQTKIKILPYSIIYAKDFTPVSTYITE
jgi:hypothetical protein|tara:strand:- start:330 stop:674 length:345 start_codon:yes stop_codon:yes gene_type:complete